MTLHIAQMNEQGSRERVAIGKAGEAGKTLEPIPIGRQGVGLLVGHHLETVLDHTQETVSGGEIIAHLLIDPAAVGKCRERLQRLFDAQLGISSAGDELLGLHEEFDLADAAPTELDIVPFDRDLIMAAIGVDLPLHRVHVGNRREVEIFAPNEGRKPGEQRFPGRDVARARPRFDQRGALPILSAAFVVVERRSGGDGDVSGGWIGAQPQIDAKYVAVGSALLQQLHQHSREPHVKCRRLRCRDERCRVVEDDEVDVARIIELARTHFTHGEHDIARTLRQRAALEAFELAAAPRSLEQVINRGPNGRIGQHGLQVHDLRHRPNAADIGERYQQRRLRLHAAKQAHHLGFIACCRDRAPCVSENVAETVLGFGFEKRDEPLRRSAHEAPEIGRAVCQPRHQRLEPRVSRSEPCQRLAGGQTGDFGEPLVDARARLVGGLNVRRPRDPSHERTVA